MDLHERLDHGWTLIGGQLVHLHCAERNYAPLRPTDDIDTVLDVRAYPDMLETFTGVLVDLGFRPGGISAEGLQHRWLRDEAQIDVLLPDGVGERVAARLGAGGAPTLPTPGGTQALARSESIAVTVEGRQGFVRRPNLIGALVMKAAAHTAVGDAARGRHRSDFATLATLLAARDIRDADLTKKDRKRLRDMIGATRADHAVMLSQLGVDESLGRFERALDRE